MRLSRSRLVRHAMMLAFTCFSLMLVVLPVRADYTFSPFNMTVIDEYTSVPLIGAPADVYTSYSLTVDWSSIDGFPYSEEAAMGLVGGPAPYAGYPIYLDGTFASNGVANEDPITLTWEGFLETPFLGGSDPFHFYGVQTFPGSSASWENIVLTLGSEVPPPPPAISVGIPSSTEVILASEEVQWFSFEYITGPLVIDTLGSALVSDNDTEIGLYNATGNLIATNDDIDLLGGNYLSQLSIEAGSLDPGTFYLALGGYDTTFGGGFAVESTSGLTGTAVLNIVSGLPPPPDATVVDSPSSTEVILASEEVQWFSFEYITGPLVIDTLGSALVSDNDTEIGLYNAAGNLIATNDDIDLFGGNFLSRLDIPSGVLDPGTYYLAFGGFNTIFENNFNVSSFSELTGTAVLNINFTLGAAAPEPGTLSLLAMGGLLVFGFRKRLKR